MAGEKRLEPRDLGSYKWGGVGFWVGFSFRDFPALLGVFGTFRWLVIGGRR